MVVVVESESALALLAQKVTQKPITVIPVASDPYLHAHNTRISLLYIATPDERFAVSINHNDAINYALDNVVPILTQASAVYTPSKIRLSHLIGVLPNVCDVNMLSNLDAGQTIEEQQFDTPIHRQLVGLFSKQKNVNDAIPLLKHVEKSAHLTDEVQQLVSASQRLPNDEEVGMYDRVVLPTLQRIESAGIHVNSELFVQRFGSRQKRHITEQSLVYSEYNPYTVTGRPSNRFGGVNFAAVNKLDGSRSAFTSRFGEDGKLMLFDFESYHLRLIANLIEYDFPPYVPIHEYLGQQYFNTSTITEEPYNESKKTTFWLLYGGIDDAYTHIPFFQEVKKFIDSMYGTFLEENRISVPTVCRKLPSTLIEEPTEQKVFNYLIQGYETENSMRLLKGLLDTIEPMQSKVVLYTYDSILCDVSKDELDTIIEVVPKHLEDGGKFPIRAFEGDTYQDMIQVG